MDKVSPEKRSWTMAQVKGRNTGPEKVVRSLLHRMGYRFRLQRADLPGKPDIVLPKYRMVILFMAVFGTAMLITNAPPRPLRILLIGIENLSEM